MPTYDYQCRKCGYTFEVFHNMSYTFKKNCPKCSGQVRKLIGSGCGLIFKGSGFYITDYKKKSAKVDIKKESPKENAETKEKPVNSAAGTDKPKTAKEG